MRVMVCGDRNWTDRQTILNRLAKLPKDTIIIEGGARGADILALSCAKELGLDVAHYPAKWRLYGKAAGPIRNELMLEEGNPDLVIAFHNDLPSSKGTSNMVGLANRAGVSVVIVKEASDA